MKEKKKMTMKSVVRTAWWCGALAAFGAMSLFQDILGQERYIEYARDHWMTPWISVPIAIVMVLWGLLGHAAALTHAKENDAK